MKNVIGKIFSGDCDEEVHNDFVKFSRGVFENRYLLEGKRQASKWAIKSSAEFANFFVSRALGSLSGSVKVKGAIICTFDLREETEIEVVRIKQFAGVKQHLIDSEVEVEELKKLMDKYPKVFFALTFSFPDGDLKVKAKPPKSGKPGKKGDDEGPKADFCAIKTTDEELVKNLFFDFPNFKEVKIRHTIEVKDIELPKGIEDPREVREKAVRKGIVKRIVAVDGRAEESEKDFVA